METIKKDYRTINNNTYKIVVYYRRDKYGSKPRGFYLSVNKIEYQQHATHTIETYSPADGYLALIMETSRLSEKSKNEALNIIQGHWIDKAIEIIELKNNNSLTY